FATAHRIEQVERSCAPIAANNRRWAMMGEPWMWIAGVVVLGGLAVALVWAALRHPRRISVESARKLFHLQRERLELRFFVLASQTGKPRGREQSGGDLQV